MVDRVRVSGEFLVEIRWKVARECYNDSDNLVIPLVCLSSEAKGVEMYTKQVIGLDPEARYRRTE